MISYTRYSSPTDPGWKQQWSLVSNACNNCSPAGSCGCIFQVNSHSDVDDSASDINVEPVWMQGIDGSGVVVAIVDNGKAVETHDVIIIQCLK